MAPAWKSLVSFARAIYFCQKATYGSDSGWRCWGSNRTRSTSVGASGQGEEDQGEGRSGAPGLDTELARRFSWDIKLPFLLSYPSAFPPSCLPSFYLPTFLHLSYLSYPSVAGLLEPTRNVLQGTRGFAMNKVDVQVVLWFERHRSSFAGNRSTGLYLQFEIPSVSAPSHHRP